jgi:MFS family permease
MSRSWRTPLLVLIAGTAIATISLGLRQTLGLFLRPMTLELGWTREAFTVALAVQNILWGLFQPLTGMLADRHGAGRIVVAGTVAYAAGLWLSGLSGSPWMFVLTAGVLLGFAQSATTQGVVFGAIVRATPPQRRDVAMGIASAGGSIGQFVLLPVSQALIGANGWVFALAGLAGIALVMAPLAAVVAGAPDAAADAQPARPGRAFGQAMRHPSYWLLFSGFFACGFHLAFLGTHLPAYVADFGVPASAAALALALVGLFNIPGSFFFGAMSQRFSKKKVLAALYFARTVAIGLFALAPPTPASLLIFSGAMGLLWLGTVPPTAGLVGQMFGLRNFSMLFGFVFLGHQLGSFFGVWLAGWIYDATGSYNLMWLAAIGVGLFATAVHLPIREGRAEPADEPLLTPATAK